MPGVYRLEYASSRRAGCRNAECKKADIKIEKNELRFGTQVPFEDKQTWHWKHWGCTTPQQIASLNGVIEGNLEYLDGFEDLSFDDQLKVQRALENGHVDDDDWKGDVERNRPGLKGFRTPAYVLKHVEKEANNEDGSPSKPTPKKRGRAKDNENNVEDEMDKPATKKAKAASKKTKKSKIDEAENASEDEASPPKKARGRSKKVKAEDASEDEVAPTPAKKAREQNKKVKAEAANEAKLVKEEGNNDAIMSDVAVRRTRLPRKVAEAKAVKEEEVEDELNAENVEETAKPKLGRKKGGANGTATKTARGAKKGGVADAEGSKKATSKASRTKAA